MSLVNCPECGHEVSTSATECPNCGRPFPRPAAYQEPIVAPVSYERERFPSWVFIPIGILGAVLLIAFFVLIGRNGDEDANSVNVNITAKRTAAENRSAPAGRTETQVVTVPPASGVQTVTVPASQGTSSTVSEAPASSKGAVTIDAKITSGTGSPRAVRNEKFYLLDKELELILSDAGLKPVAGQTLIDSFGMSVLYPDRYGDFNRDALTAINRHIKYSTLTDGSGKAQIKDIEPDSYYLFGITKTGKGFAVWSSPVTISGGQNILNLSPQPLTEIQE